MYICLICSDWPQNTKTIAVVAVADTAVDTVVDTTAVDTVVEAVVEAVAGDIPATEEAVADMGLREVAAGTDLPRLTEDGGEAVVAVAGEDAVVVAGDEVVAADIRTDTRHTECRHKVGP